MKPATHAGFSRRLWTATLIVLLAIYLPGQENKPEPTDPVPVESILQGPDRVEMPWKVQWSQPRLMYQQRFLLVVKATLPAELLHSGAKQHVVNFIAKVQDASGRWIEGGQYNRFEPKADLDKTQEIECYMAIYLRPGTFTVAMIAFDETSKKLNLTRKNFLIRPIAGDSIPDLNSHIPNVEFPSEFPQAEASGMGRFNGELFPIGDFSPLEIPSRQPIRIDVALNVSEPEHGYRTHRRGFNSWNFPGPPKGVTVGSVVQVGSILARIAPTNGCVFVTALDPSRMKVAVPAKPIESIDWEKLQQQLTNSDQSMIDVRVLQNHKGPGMFIRQTLEALGAQNATCGSEPVAVHYILFVSPSYRLPEFGKEMLIPPSIGEKANLYYFYIRNGRDDDMGRILKSAGAKRLEFTDPAGFRSALAGFVRDLRGSATNPGTGPEPLH